MSQLEQTYINLRGVLKSFIYSRVNDEALAEDILHDVFLKVHTNLDKLRDFKKLDGWIYRIAKNAITDYYRSKKPDALLDGTDVKDNKEEHSALEKLEPSVRAFIRKLPLIYREALILTDYKGLTQAELAERLNLSLSAAKSRVQRAKKMLKEMFLECCHFEFDKFGTVIDYHPRCCGKCE